MCSRPRPVTGDGTTAGLPSSETAGAPITCDRRDIARVASRRSRRRRIAVLPNSPPLPSEHTGPQGAPSNAETTETRDNLSPLNRQNFRHKTGHYRHKNGDSVQEQPLQAPFCRQPPQWGCGGRGFRLQDAVRACEMCASAVTLEANQNARRESRHPHLHSPVEKRLGRSDESELFAVHGRRKSSSPLRRLQPEQRRTLLGSLCTQLCTRGVANWGHLGLFQPDLPLLATATHPSPEKSKYVKNQHVTTQDSRSSRECTRRNVHWPLGVNQLFYR